MSKDVDFIPYNKQSIDESDIDAVVSALKSNYITTGPEAEKFENKISEYCNSSYATVCSNATSALQMVLEGLNIKKGDVVVSSPISFIAAANAAKQVDAEVRFCDVDEINGNMDLECLENILKNEINIKVVMPVHLAGVIVDMERLKKLSIKYKFKIIEDACHALGGGYWDISGKYNKIGNCAHSNAAVFSFHPIKSITTGEGGAITTNDKNLDKRMKVLRNHGIYRLEEDFVNKEMAYTKNDGSKILNTWYYEMHHLAHNFRLTDFQCALGISQLNKLDKFIQKRQVLSKLYTDLLNESKDPIVQIPNYSKNIVHAFHLYIVLIDFRKLKGGRANLMKFLLSKNIQTQVHYIPIHLQPFYKKDNLSQKNFPQAEKFYQKCLSLPLFPDMLDKQVNYVVKNLIEGISIHNIS